jgi:hypothetical protein
VALGTVTGIKWTSVTSSLTANVHEETSQLGVTVPSYRFTPREKRGQPHVSCRNFVGGYFRGAGRDRRNLSTKLLYAYLTATFGNLSTFVAVDTTSLGTFIDCAVWQNNNIASLLEAQ